MSPLVPLLALAAAALLAGAGALRVAPRPAPRPAPHPARGHLSRDNSLDPQFINKQNCKTIVIESPYLKQIDQSLQLTVTFSSSHYPSAHGPLVDVTDYCSMIVLPGDGGLGPVRYILTREEVTACSSRGAPSVSALADHVVSPVSAACSYREAMCEPLDLTVVQTCLPGFL